MKIIPIDYSTVKVNPEAGRTINTVKGATRITGVYRGKRLHDSDDIAVTETERISRGDGSEEWTTSFEIKSSKIPTFLTKNSNVELTKHHQNQHIHHDPKPRFLFKHIATKLLCDSCNQMIKVELIDEHVSDNGISYKACPNCQNVETFEGFEYEKLPGDFKLPIWDQNS